MEFRRIFYRLGGHDEIPVDTVLEDGAEYVFMSEQVELLRVLIDDVIAVEER